MKDAKRGLALSRRSGNRRAEVLHLLILGACVSNRGHPEDGVAPCEKALSIANELDDQSCRLAALHYLAYVYNKAGLYDRAAKLSLERLDLGRELADVQTEAAALGTLGDAYRGLGRYQEAAQALGAALELYRQGHDRRRRHVGLCLLKLGYTHREMGEDQQADGYLHASIEIFHELHLPHYEKRARDALRDSRTLHSVQLAERRRRDSRWGRDLL